MDNADQSSSQQPQSGLDTGIESNPPAQISVAGRKEATSTEVITASEPSLEIHPELAKIGVEGKTEHPILTEQQKQAGFKLSEPPPVITHESTMHPLPPLSMSEAQLKHIARTGKIESTIRWFANLYLIATGKNENRKLKPGSSNI